MALTKFEIASSAMVLIGEQPVTSFDVAGGAPEIAAAYLYQSCVDHWLSMHPWRFASRTLQLPRRALPPDTQWQAAYTAPQNMKAIQSIRVDRNGSDIEYDRFENMVMCNATETQAVWCIHTYEPPIAWWPGYFVELMEVALAAKFAFAITGKLDLRVDLEKSIETNFRLAKNADSRQQTTRRFKLTGRRSIMEARRA